MKIKNKVRNYSAIIFLFAIFVFCFMLLYRQTKEIKIKEYELSQNDFAKVVTSKPFNSYWNVLDYIGSKEYLKIKKVDTSVVDKGYICVDLEFKGSMQLLDYFLESLKTDEIIKKINNIKVKEEGKNAFFAEINIEFNH